MKLKRKSSAKSAAGLFRWKTTSRSCLKKSPARSRNSGFILIVSIFLTGSVLASLIYVGQRLNCLNNNFSLFESRRKTFYLALAAAEKARYLFKNDTAWKPTDQPFSGPAEKLVPWLVNNYSAGGSTGRIESLSTGSYKIVWETGLNFFYALGFTGNSPGHQQLTIFKTTFSNTGAFQIIQKEEI